ncbi:MAG: hypothetical protein ACPGFA_10170 [Pikeienuella sp.]
MRDCVVLAGNARDASLAANWAASCAARARMTADEGKALAARIRDRYVTACEALFGAQGGTGRQVMLSAEFGEGQPRFELIADGAVACDAIGPKCDAGPCDGLTCFRLID